MKFLQIQNIGELDIRLVALMGGTTKSKDKYKIGQFGTGLKYTLAFLFRNNLAFKIFVGDEEVKVTTETETIRDEVFEIICINGHRTSITTKMGEDWQPWMIIRELWCNALDEGMALRDIVTDTVGTPGKTTFYIQIDSQIQQVINDWSKYFLHSKLPLYQTKDYALYPAGEKLCIYKQGILVYEHPDMKSVFSYDIATADINELREFRGSPAQVITQALHDCNEKAAEYFLENVTDEHYEGKDMDYEWYVPKWGEAWTKVIGSAKLIHQKALDEIKARGDNPNMSELLVVPKCVYKALTKQFAGIGALRAAGKAGDFYESYNEDMEGRLNQALVILEHCGYPMHNELSFLYGFFENKKIQARVNLDQKKVYISNTLLQQPLFTIVAMLIEENEHFNTGLSDETREFQQHFINLYARTLLAKHEVEI